MYKFVLVIILIFTTFAPAYSYDWRTDYRDITQQKRNQRIESISNYLVKNGAFSKKQKELKAEFAQYKQDENFKENLNFVKHNKPLSSNNYKVTGNYQRNSDKILVNYSIKYNNKPNYKFAYDYAGHLVSVTINGSNSDSIPYWTETYSAFGYLQKVSLFASDTYEYVFLPNGDFQGVVIQKTLYNRTGRPVKVWML